MFVSTVAGIWYGNMVYGIYGITGSIWYGVWVYVGGTWNFVLTLLWGS